MAKRHRFDMGMAAHSGLITPAGRAAPPPRNAVRRPFSVQRTFPMALPVLACFDDPVVAYLK